MIIEVDHSWHYNAPSNIQVGDRVIREGLVTQVNAAVGTYAGPIKAILGRADVKVSFKAPNQEALEVAVGGWLRSHGRKVSSPHREEAKVSFEARDQEGLEAQIAVWLRGRGRKVSSPWDSDDSSDY